jgi:hypothetical protein
MSDTDPSDDARRVHRAAVDRQHERAAAVEELLAVGGDEPKFPTRSDEVAAAYAGDREDLPNETESLAEALDRVDDVRDEPVATFDPESPAADDVDDVDLAEDGPDHAGDVNPADDLTGHTSGVDTEADDD